MNEPTLTLPTIPTFQMLPLSKLMESPHNNRRHFDAKKLEELTASVRQKGVLTPLLARPAADDKFEIAAGHRRLRAALAAGNVEEVPVLVREMSDAEFLEVITIENLQREDVHPMDEGLGYSELLTEHSYTVEQLALRISRSKEYVYSRLKLVDLIPEIQVRFYEDKLTAGHAILLARLSEQGQMDTVKNGLYEDHWDGQKSVKALVSVRDLGRWIQQKLHLLMKRAPFSPKDAELVPAAGACIGCPKRTATTPELWPDIAEDTCTDRACYESKVRAFVARQVEVHKAAKVFTNTVKNKKDDGDQVFGYWDVTRIEDAKDRCPSQTPAVIMDGSEAGQVLKICADIKCAKHGQYNKQRQRVAPAPRAESVAAAEKRLAAETARESAFIFQEHVRRRIAQDVLASFSKTRKVWPEHLELIALRMYQLFEEGPGYDVEWDEEVIPDVHKAFGLPESMHRGIGADGVKAIQKLNQEKIALLLLQMVIVQELEVPRHRDLGPSFVLKELAEVHNVDVKAIETEVRQEMARVSGQAAAIDEKKASGPAKKKPVQTSAKRATKKKTGPKAKKSKKAAA